MKGTVAAMFAAKIVMAGSFAVSGMIGLAGHSSADPSLANDGTSFVRQSDGYLAHVDDATGQRIEEDDPRWSCVDDGNRICGPGNAQGAPAGCYDDGGVLVADLPCYVVIDPQTGDSDVYTPDDRPGHPTEVY